MARGWNVFFMVSRKNVVAKKVVKRVVDGFDGSVVTFTCVYVCVYPNLRFEL